MRLFISAPHPPSVVARGLYAGLKSLNGRHTSLPVVLDDDVYVNAGFIDGLNTSFVSLLQLQDIALRLIFKGSLLIQWYFLDQSAEVRHFADAVVKQTTKDNEKSIADVRVPPVLLSDSSVRLVYFRVLNNPSRAEARPSHLINWCFHSQYTKEPGKVPLLMISRSLGDAPSVINQHLAHYKHYLDLRRIFSDLDFLPMPVLNIHESDGPSYEAAKKLLTTSSTNELPIKLYRNQYNLGGGGNMYLALRNSLGQPDMSDDFLMVDSDTLIPFKTLYTTALLSECSSRCSSELSPVVAPVIAYRTQGTRILEAGAIFGRGAWNLYQEYPVQPCINPFFHSLDLADKITQAKLSGELPTDYPPFIYSLYRMKGEPFGKSMMPVPFFLRGDDVEYGFFLKDRGLGTQVLGSLLVFQDPKHSPWHEFMAILHATTILLAYCEDGNSSVLRRNLYSYFASRRDNHLAMRDVKGLMIYSKVLECLCMVLDTDEKSLISEYYNPDAYLSLRSLNAAYSDSNYILACQLPDDYPADQCLKLPFLYYDGLSSCTPLPQQVFLVNHLSKTAAVFSPCEVSPMLSTDTSIAYMSMLSKLLGRFDALRDRCKKLLDREEIHGVFESAYHDAMSRP